MRLRSRYSPSFLTLFEFAALVLLFSVEVVDEALVLLGAALEPDVLGAVVLAVVLFADIFVVVLLLVVELALLDAVDFEVAGFVEVEAGFDAAFVVAADVLRARGVFAATLAFAVAGLATVSLYLFEVTLSFYIFSSIKCKSNCANHCNK